MPITFKFVYPNTKLEPELNQFVDLMLTRPWLKDAPAFELSRWSLQNKQHIKNIFEKEGRTITAKDCLGPMDVSVYILNIKGYLKGGYPIAGQALGANKSVIYVDPLCTTYKNDFLTNAFASLFTHETHHNKRFTSLGIAWTDMGPRTLAEALTAEGLAQNFEIERGYKDSPCAFRLSETELHQAAEKAKKVLFTKDPYPYPIHQKWFAGKASPPNAGYSLSFAIVQGWLNYTGRKASEAACVDPREIMNPWLEGKYPLHIDKKIQAHYPKNTLR